MTRIEALDRHALVTTVWLSAGLVAATLFHYGLRHDGPWVVGGAFGMIAAGFVGHVIVNAVLGTRFTPREVALGLGLYAGALIAFGIATLANPHFAARAFLPVSAGFLVLFIVVVFTMIVQSGVRGAFDSFDVIRTFRGRKHPDTPERDASR